MGISQTCVKGSSCEIQDSQEVKSISKKQIIFLKEQTTSENYTINTTLKKIKNQADADDLYQVIQESQSSNIEQSPVPQFVKNKEYHKYMVPIRENRFINDLEQEIKAKIKEIYQQEQMEAQQSSLINNNQYSQPTKQQKSSQKILDEKGPTSQLNCQHHSMMGIEKLQSTQLECITVPENRQKSILKKQQSKLYSSSVDDKPKKLEIKKVHFSLDTKFRSDGAKTLFQWRNLRNI